MANIGSVVVQFLGKDKLSDVAGKVTSSLKGVDDQSGKAKRGFGKLSAAWAAAIPIAGAVIGAGIGMANVLLDASKAALEDKNSSDKLAKVLRNIPGVTQKMIDANEDWISSMQLATLVSDTDLRDAIGKLTLATGSLTEAQKLTALATDVAAGSNKSLSTVTDALAKAANGQTTQLKRLYPWLKTNKDGTVDYGNAVKQLGEKYKGSAKEATKTKPWETIQTIWGEIQESLGGVLLPLFEKFGKWFSDKKNQDAIKRFIDKVATLATQLGEKLVNAIETAITWLGNPGNQKKIQVWIAKFGLMAEYIGNVIRAVKLLITWLSKIKVPKINVGGSQSVGPLAAPAGRAARTTPTAPPPEPVVLVTEEQIYRAVSRLMMRGEARNGRLARLA